MTIEAAIASSIGCTGRRSVPVAASPSVIECATVNAVTIFRSSSVISRRSVAAVHPGGGAAQHRRQQQQQQECHVVVADQHVPESLAQELAERRKQRRRDGLGPLRAVHRQHGRHRSGGCHELEQRRVTRAAEEESRGDFDAPGFGTGAFEPQTREVLGISRPEFDGAFRQRHSAPPRRMAMRSPAKRAIIERARVDLFRAPAAIAVTVEPERKFQIGQRDIPAHGDRRSIAAVDDLQGARTVRMGSGGPRSRTAASRTRGFSSLRHRHGRRDPVAAGRALRHLRIPADAAANSNVSEAQRLSQSASMPAGAAIMWTAATRHMPGRASQTPPGLGIAANPLVLIRGARAGRRDQRTRQRPAIEQQPERMAIAAPGASRSASAISSSRRPITRSIGPPSVSPVRISAFACRNKLRAPRAGSLRAPAASRRRARGPCPSGTPRSGPPASPGTRDCCGRRVPAGPPTPGVRRPPGRRRPVRRSPGHRTLRQPRSARYARYSGRATSHRIRRRHNGAPPATHPIAARKLEGSSQNSWACAGNASAATANPVSAKDRRAVKACLSFAHRAPQFRIRTQQGRQALAIDWREILTGVRIDFVEQFADCDRFLQQAGRVPAGQGSALLPGRRPGVRVPIAVRHDLRRKNVRRHGTGARWQRLVLRQRLTMQHVGNRHGSHSRPDACETTCS